MRIYIDGEEVSEAEYFDRVYVEDETEPFFADEFFDLFDGLGAEFEDRDGKILDADKLAENVSEAYLNFIDFVTYTGKELIN